MADTSITPYGYIYGKDPKANHPFWGGSGPDIEEYVKSLNGTVTETEDGKIYTINATDGDDVVTKVIDILVPNVEVPEIPTDYVTSVGIQKVEAANQDSYYFTYYTKDGESHAFGTMVIKKDYVSSVDVTGEESGGVKTITIDVDGDEASFDVPTQYVKSVTQSAGQHDDDLYTFTDENGHTTQISSPWKYIQELSATKDSNVEAMEITQRGVVNDSAATSRLVRISLIPPSDNPDNMNEIQVSNAAGDVASMAWGNGTTINDITVGGVTYKPCVGHISTTVSYSSFGAVKLNSKYGHIEIGNGSVTIATKPEFCFRSTGASKRIDIPLKGVYIINAFSITKNTEYANDNISIAGYVVGGSIGATLASDNDYNNTAVTTSLTLIAYIQVINTTKNERETFILSTPYASGSGYVTVRNM